MTIPYFDAHTLVCPRCRTKCWWNRTLTDEERLQARDLVLQDRILPAKERRSMVIMRRCRGCSAVIQLCHDPWPPTPVSTIQETAT